MTMPLPPGGYAPPQGYAPQGGYLNSRFGERPGPLATCLILLPLAVALMSAAMLVILLGYEDWGGWSDVWGGVRAVLAIGVGLLIASVVVVTVTSTTGHLLDFQNLGFQGQQNIGAPQAGVGLMSRRRFGDRPGPLVAVIILEILGMVALSASTTSWLIAREGSYRSFGYAGGIFEGVWGEVYVFFAIGIVLIGVAVVIAVSTTKMPRQLYIYPPQMQYAAQAPAGMPSQPMGMAPPVGDPVAQVPVDPQPQSDPSTASTDQSEPESSAPSAD